MFLVSSCREHRFGVARSQQYPGRCKRATSVDEFYPLPCIVVGPRRKVQQVDAIWHARGDYSLVTSQRADSAVKRKGTGTATLLRSRPLILPTVPLASSNDRLRVITEMRFTLSSLSISVSLFSHFCSAPPICSANTQKS